MGAPACTCSSCGGSGSTSTLLYGSTGSFSMKRCAGRSCYHSLCRYARRSETCSDPACRRSAFFQPQGLEARPVRANKGRTRFYSRRMAHAVRSKLSCSCCHRTGTVPLLLSLLQHLTLPDRQACRARTGRLSAAHQDSKQARKDSSVGKRGAQRICIAGTLLYFH